MKKLILLIGLFIGFTSPCYANDWTKADTAYQLTYTALHLVDWMQTNEIAGDDNYYERNPILGKYPSKGRVHTYFISTLLINTTICYLLPSRYRRWWQAGIIAIEVGCVANNYSIGVRIW